MLQPPTDQAEDEHEPPPPPPPAPSGGTPRPVRRSRSRTGNTPPGHGSPTHGSPPRPFGGSPPSPPGPPSILRTAPAPASSTPFGRGSRPSAATPRQPATTPPISGSRRNKRQPAAPKLPAKASDSKSKINVAGSRQSPGWVGPTKDRPSPPELTIPTTSPPAPGSPGSSPGKREVFQLRKQIAQLQEENSKLNDQTNGYMSNQAALSKKLEEQDSAHKELEQTLKSVLPQLATGAQDGGNKSKHGQAPQAPRAQMQVPAATLQQQQRMPAAQVLRLPGNAGGRGVEKGLPQMLPDNSCFHFSILGVLLCLALAVLLLLNGHSECGMPAEDPPTQPAWVIPDGSSSVLPPPALPVVQAAGTDEHGGQLPATPAAAEAEARAAVRASAATFGTQGSVDKEETPLLRTQRREAREAEKPATAASDRLRRKLASAAGLGPAMMVAPAAKPPTTGAATGGDKPSNPAALLQAAVQANECKSAPCQNGGTCSDLVGKYKCQCAGGWAGDNCEVSSGSTAQEKLNAATKLREAVRKMLQAKTKPVAPAAEDSATEPEETAEAAATAPAAATATEADQDDLGAEEWQAALLSAHDECKSVPCQNGGSCSDLLGHYQCVCVKGWRGANCEVNFDDCASSPCVNDALGCEDGVDEFKCTCSDGWEADDCSVEIDECGSHPCAHGSCADVVAGYECTCTDGWVGENCAEDVDECLSLPCNNGGTCGQVDDGASPFYTCGCVAGFEGDECGLDVDECESLPCLRGGACSDGVASYECKCVDGFIGERCDVDVDECLSSPCENGGSCVESGTVGHEAAVGSYFCACAEGWAGTDCGRTTVEIMVAEDRERRAAERAKGARRRQMQEEAARQADVAAAAEAAARGAAAGASRVGGRVGVQKPKLAMSEIVGRRAATAGLAGQPPPSEMGPPPPRSMGPPPPRALARPPPPPPQQQQAAAPPPAPQLATEDDALAAVRDARLVQQAARPPPPPPPVVRAAVVSEADQAFERFDTNGSGVLETEEARLLVAKVGLEMSTAELTAITEALRDRATFGQIMRPYLHVLV